jgi:LPS-assembly protein
MRRHARPVLVALLVGGGAAPPLRAADPVSVPGPAAAPAPTLRLETELREANLGNDGSRPLWLRGDRVDGRAGRDITLEGEAEVRSAGTVVRADRLTYYETDDEVIAIGNVRVVREGQVFTGPQLQLRLEASQGYFEQPRYYLPLSGARGSAERVDFLGRTAVALTNATYTTCRPDDPDWYLKAGSITLDRTAEEGEARNATLYFMDVPIGATPYFGFPLGDRRRSGFLAPSLSATNTLGGEVRVPYYWNIAPNYDLTLLTAVSGQRGLQLGAIARYLERNFFGSTLAEYVPDDRVTGTSRWQINSSHITTDWAGWSGGWTIRGVSDDEYFVDYSRSIAQSAERSLPREAWATRPLGDWLFRMRALSYQNILEARASPPYDRLPQFTLTRVNRELGDFDAGLYADLTTFSIDRAGAAQGTRAIVNPSLGYTFGTPGWFVTPKAALHATAYRLDVNPVGPLDIDRSIPTFSLDTGMVFERPSTLGGRAVIQTLEPRLFYVYTPYVDQSNIPVFDTTVSNLSFATLFNENIFAGGDRIADANQVTLGAISRYIDAGSGVEWLRVGAGQRIYFQEQRVTIPGVPLRTDSRSDLLLVAAGNLGGGHSVDAGVQWSLGDRAVPRLGFAWRWWPATERLLNLAVRYQELDYAQIDGSWRWPVAQRWTTLGRINYSVLREQYNPATGGTVPVSPQLLEGLVGFEYSADCWTARFVAQRFITATAQRTSAFFFQLELGGFARIGLDPFDILVRNIPGYQPPLQRQLAPSRFYGYE